MDSIYLILVVILFVLAASDLVVGVSNDAVNFLNSAIGSKSAPMRVILFVASLGIFLGATFSTGMMEVARNGIFNPQFFFFSEIMIIFLVVMITDVILLDMFNTLGLPTSTTVSLVFELMGAAVAASVFKLSSDTGQTILVDGIEKVATLGDYINTSKSLGIISGILSSVVIAFTTGILIQFIVRLVFSFNYEVKLKYLGSFWGGIAITAITYFLLVKGAKDSVFMSTETKTWIKENSNLIILYSLVGWTLVLQLLKSFFKLNILKMIVLTGTFALAWAFAGNDLVNFIGVPIAGFNSFEFLSAAPGAQPDSFLMVGLGASNEVTVPSYMLIIAGAIMVLTLWFSKKARLVTKTEVDLSRQHEGEERFGSSFLARTIVRGTLKASQSVNQYIPTSVKKFFEKQFDASEYEEKRQKQGADAPNFDLLRGSVNLVISSILISIATSHKLPLSTTYVTFMVAMGTSLADRSWGRESAVYRVTGVLSVIGGWFFTAFVAFTAAFVFATLIFWLGLWMVFALIALSLYVVYHTHIITIKKLAKTNELKDIEMEEIDSEMLPGRVFEKCKSSVTGILSEVSKLYSDTLTLFESNDRKGLKNIVKEVETINKTTKDLRYNIYPTVRKLQEESIDSSLYYVQVIDYLRETAHCMTYITKPCYDHLDNNHKTLSDEQFQDLRSLKKEMVDLLEKVVVRISKNDFGDIEKLINDQQQIMEQLRVLRKKQLKRIKKDKAGTKVSLLYLNILHESQNILLHLINVAKAQRDFVAYQHD